MTYVCVWSKVLDRSYVKMCAAQYDMGRLVYTIKTHSMFYFQHLNLLQQHLGQRRVVASFRMSRWALDHCLDYKFTCRHSVVCRCSCTLVNCADWFDCTSTTACTLNVCLYVHLSVYPLSRRTAPFVVRPLRSCLHLLSIVDCQCKPSIFYGIAKRCVGALRPVDDVDVNSSAVTDLVLTGDKLPRQRWSIEYDASRQASHSLLVGRARAYTSVHQAGNTLPYVCILIGECVVRNRFHRTKRIKEFSK